MYKNIHKCILVKIKWNIILLNSHGTVELKNEKDTLFEFIFKIILRY